MTVAEVLEELAERRSTWNRMDVLRTLAATARPQPGHDATSWTRALEAGADRVLDACIDLDPTIGSARRRGSDGRSLLIEPVANQATSEHVLAQEERIITWAIDAQSDDPTPSTTITDTDLDDSQHSAARASSPVMIGSSSSSAPPAPARPGCSPPPSTTSMPTGVRWSASHRPARPLPCSPARLASRRTRSPSSSYTTSTNPSASATWWDPGPGTTVIVDEAGMVRTADLDRLVDHAQRSRWRLVLVGDPYQLQAVGRGGMFAELCETGRTVELDRLHRFEHPWEATASLRLRTGDSRALATYATFGRIHPGTFDEHLDTIAGEWQHVPQRR